MDDIKTARFLQDEASQRLALGDALASANGPAVWKAFDAVARSKGLAQIARDSHVSLDDLRRALADPLRPDIAFLLDVLKTLDNSRLDIGKATHPSSPAAPSTDVDRRHE